MQAMEISRTALDVEWRRLDVIAQNLANTNTTRTASGEPYQALRLISGPRGGFADYLKPGTAAGTAEMSGVAVYGVEPMNLPPRLVYEPEHPHADENGYVAYPAIDQAAEMTLLVKTSRAYEANIVMMNAARQMYVKAMELGRR